METTENEPDVYYGMTLGALRAALQELAHLPDGTPVVMAKDAEGNGHSPLSSVDECMYLPETTWRGEVHFTPEDVAADPALTEEDMPPAGAERAVLLGPIN